jgi:hypothetical protein
MSDEFFLRYANQLFIDDPKNLKLVIQEFIRQHRSMREEGGRWESESYPEWCVRFMADTIDIFSDCKDFDTALKFTPKIKSQAKLEIRSKKLRSFYNVDDHIDMALEAVFYYRNESCINRWDDNEYCTGYHSDPHGFGLAENYRIKCHECYQLYFRSMLLNFVKNKGFHQRIVKKGDTKTKWVFDEEWFEKHSLEHDEIVISGSNNRNSFDYYLEKAYDCVAIVAYVPIHSQHIVKCENFEMTNLLNNKHSIYPLETRFNDYLISVVSYSLVEFLRKNNFKKLKICPFCNNFFIAKDIKREKRCYSKECEKAYQREKKRKQREKDPLRYC